MITLKKEEIQRNLAALLRGDQGRFDPTRSCMSIRFYNLNEGNKCYENSLNRFIK